MQIYCHCSPDRLLWLQSCSLLIVLSFSIFILSSLPVVLAGCLSLIMGTGLWNGDAGALQDWFLSTVFFAFATASILIALAIFVKTYLRTQFGAPAYYSELQTDLSQAQVLKMCCDFMRAHAVDEDMIVDTARGRLVGLMDESRLSSTYLEMSTLELEPNRTWVVVRAASIVGGKAALLSAFYNDLGAARAAVNSTIDIFSPYASRKRRPYPGSSSKQALPLVRQVDDCPPPLLAKVRLGR
jgi:hypothetical protein